MILKATLISLISKNCGNIQSTTSLYLSCNFLQLFIVNTQNAMLWKKSIFQSPQTSTSLNIISSFTVFNYLQSNWRTTYSSYHSAKSHMLYEALATHRIYNLELFRTDLLKCPSELSSWYKVVVKGKGS